MKFLYLALLLSAAFLVAAAAQESEPEAEAQTAEERYSHLERDKSGFSETWVNPETDWTRFDSLYLWTAEFQYRDVGPAQRSRSTMMSTRQREFGIADNDRELFETTVSEAFLKEIQKARKFEIVEVDDITESTIIMRGAVLDIVSFVPPPHTGRSDIYLASIGEATLVLELIDAKTGEVAAVVAERRRLQSGTGQIDTFSMPTNRATVIGDIRRWARRSAVILRDALDEAIMGR